MERRPTPSSGAAATQETPPQAQSDFVSAGVALAPVGEPEVESQPRQDLGDKVSCTYVHVAAICMGYSHATRLVRLLKSMLMHRATPLHLHIVTDLETQVRVQSLRRGNRSTAAHFRFIRGQGCLSQPPYTHYIPHA